MSILIGVHFTNSSSYLSARSDLSDICDWFRWSCRHLVESTITIAAAAAGMPPPTDYTLSHYTVMMRTPIHIIFYTLYCIIIIIQLGPIVTSIAAAAAVPMVAV